MSRYAAIALAFIACSDDPSNGGSDATTTSDTSTDTSEPNAVAIVDRPAAETHTCTVSTPMARVTDADWRPEALISVGSDTWFLRVGMTSLSLSPIGADGTLGTPDIEIDPDDYASQMADAVALDDTHIAVAWRHDDTQLGGATVHFAVAKTDGTMAVSGRELSGTASNQINDVRIIADEGGATLVFYTQSDDAGETSLVMRPVDAAGTAAEPIKIADTGQTFGATNFDVLRLANGGLAIAYTSGNYENSEVQLARYTADLTPQGAILVSRTATDGFRSYAGTRAMVELDGKLWLAWTESWTKDPNDFVDPEGTVTTKIASFSNTSETYTLVAPETDKTFSDARLFALDGKLAVTWSSGTIIYICGGCITDYDLNLMLVDPATVVPASAIATQLHQNNGIVRAYVAVDGNVVQTIASLDFHALSYPAIGAFTCSAE